MQINSEFHPSDDSRYENVPNKLSVTIGLHAINTFHQVIFVSLIYIHSRNK